MITRPEHAFWSRLSLQQQAWLAQQLHAQHTSPADFIAWIFDGVTVGRVSPERAQHMVALLPGCTFFKDQLHWQPASDPPLLRSHALQGFLLQQAACKRLEGWRGEFLAWWLEMPPVPPALEVPPFLCVERAGFRHLGMMSHAVHIHGFLPLGDVWCGRRSALKATDPGLLDNLAAGGLAAGERPLDTARRELAEEASFYLTDPRRLRWSGVIRTQRPEPQGWHDEQLLVYTLELYESEIPINADGEVQEFLRISPSEVISRMQKGHFTADAVASLAQSLAWLMPPEKHP